MNVQPKALKAAPAPSSPVESFGYLGLHSDKLEDWAAFGPRFLGLELIERTRTTLKFRMDDRKQRILVSSDPAIVDTFGWEVGSASIMEAIAARVEAAKMPVMRVPATECALRAVSGAIRFADPAGNMLEVFHGPEIASAPFSPGRPISGFRTGAFGMGHAVLYVKSVDDVLWFYVDVLGFRLSDFTVNPFKAFFFHINGRHHSLALIEGGGRRIHHIMMELAQLDDVGQGYDLALQEPGRIATTLGRHTNDFMTSFYANTPGGFFIEYGWGGRTIDPASFEPTEMQFGPSLWGHERNWLPEAQLLEARAVRAKAQAAGLRAPVQVTPQNSETGFSHCPWWEQQKRAP